jgi:hypothetical protein
MIIGSGRIEDLALRWHTRPGKMWRQRSSGLLPSGYRALPRPRMLTIAGQRWTSSWLRLPGYQHWTAGRRMKSSGTGRTFYSSNDNRYPAIFAFIAGKPEAPRIRAAILAADSVSI